MEVSFNEVCAQTLGEITEASRSSHNHERNYSYYKTLGQSVHVHETAVPTVTQFRQIYKLTHLQLGYQFAWPTFKFSSFTESIIRNNNFLLYGDYKIK